MQNVKQKTVSVVTERITEKIYNHHKESCAHRHNGGGRFSVYGIMGRK